MPQKISGELRSRQLKAEVPLGRWRSSLESRAAGGAFHLIKGDLSSFVVGVKSLIIDLARSCPSYIRASNELCIPDCISVES